MLAGLQTWAAVSRLVLGRDSRSLAPPNNRCLGARFFASAAVRPCPPSSGDSLRKATALTTSARSQWRGWMPISREANVVVPGSCRRG